jgi:hypothetical protein
VVCIGQESDDKKGHASKEEAGWAKKHLPAGTHVYGRTALTDAILRQSFDNIAPLLTV